MTEPEKDNKEIPAPQPDESGPAKTFMPEHLKRPNLPPNKFKYIPPKGVKRHF